MDYLEALKLFKSSLLGGTEVGIIAETVNKHFSTKEFLSWLDVGIGDGYSLTKILKGIKPTCTLEITGVDPVLTTSDEAEKAFPDAELVAIDFEEYVTDQKFDVVNVRQSLYYLEDKELSLKKALSLVAPGGQLIVTNWAEQDIFCRLHTLLFPHSKENITGEEIIKILRRNSPGEEIEVTRFEGTVDITSWRESEEMAEAALTIISREAITSGEMQKNRLTEFRNILASLNGIEPRINLVICIKTSV